MPSRVNWGVGQAMELHSMPQSRDEFADFLDGLREDLQKNSESWENVSLPEFLEAMSAWVRDMDGYYMNMGKEMPQDISWREFAQIIYAAGFYE